MKNDFAGGQLANISLGNIGLYFDGEIDGFPLEAVEPDSQAQEGIILNVGRVFRHRRALSEAQEGVIWAISDQAGY